MKKNNAAEALSQILQEDPRYTAEAYHFLREALDFTTKLLNKPKAGITRHVSGAELLDGIRRYALQEYGAMAKTVLNNWGIFRCEDFWYLTSNLIKKSILGCTPEDSIHDFEHGYDFNGAFRAPFEPDKAMRRPCKG